MSCGQMVAPPGVKIKNYRKCMWASTAFTNQYPNIFLIVSNNLMNFNELKLICHIYHIQSTLFTFMQHKHSSFTHCYVINQVIEFESQVFFFF